MPRHRFVLVLVPIFIASPLAAQDPSTQHDVWQVQAIEYAFSEQIHETRVVRGASMESRVDMSWYFFVVRRDAQIVLVDTGSDTLSRPTRTALRERWSVTRSAPIAEALARIRIEPEQVTDVVITHHHWDHVDGISNFPNAIVHVQRSEWARIPRRIRRPIEAQGRLRLLGDDTQVLFPGIRVLLSGNHTSHHSMVEIRCSNRTICIASDAAYLYRSIEDQLASAVTVNPRKNIRDVQARVRNVGISNVIPGHDAAVFDRFPGAQERVADICR